MTERKQLHLGPGAASLVLAVVVISMSILGLLSLLQVRSDVALTRRSTELVTSQYAAAAQAEAAFARLDALVLSASAQAGGDDELFLTLLGQSLPEDMSLEGDTVTWQIQANEATDLACAVRVANTGSIHRVTWVQHLYESRSAGIEIE